MNGREMSRALKHSEGRPKEGEHADEEDTEGLISNLSGWQVNRDDKGIATRPLPIGTELPASQATELSPTPSSSLSSSSLIQQQQQSLPLDSMSTEPWRRRQEEVQSQLERDPHFEYAQKYPSDHHYHHQQQHHDLNENFAQFSLSTTKTTTSGKSPSTRGNAVDQPSDKNVPTKIASLQPKEESMRSVLDFPTLSSLREALEQCVVEDDTAVETTTTTPNDNVWMDAQIPLVHATTRQPLQRGYGDADWLLPVVDPQAQPQSVQQELQRLWTLKSYWSPLLPTTPNATTSSTHRNVPSSPLTTTTNSSSSSMTFLNQLCAQACREFQVATCAISLVDLGCQSALASHGLPISTCPRRVAFCAHAILQKQQPPSSSFSESTQSQSATTSTSTYSHVDTSTNLISSTDTSAPTTTPTTHDTDTWSSPNVCIVKDTWQDERFARNPLVLKPPHLRFYAGAPLVSPEGYKLGTFCVEGPDPKPNGLTTQQVQTLQSYAQKAMTFLVQQQQQHIQRQLMPPPPPVRRGPPSSMSLQPQPNAKHSTQSTKTSLSNSTTTATSASIPNTSSSSSSYIPADDVERLRRHAGITTNLGGLLYYEGDCVTAMLLFQESVQTLMSLEATLSAAASTTQKTEAAAAAAASAIPSGFFLPTLERQEEMEQLFQLMSVETNTPESVRGLCSLAQQLFVQSHRNLMKEQQVGHSDEDENNDMETTTAPSTASGPQHQHDLQHLQSKGGWHKPLCRDICTVHGFPGLFGRNSSKLRRMPSERLELSGLVFCEPFRISVNQKPGSTETEQKHFIIPLEQCSKATLFNMGLIHYHWGRVETALQFFDLASSMYQQLPPLHFDPVILASFNNLAQIHLQFGRTSDAMELLEDAMTRGNAALSALYSEVRPGAGAQELNAEHPAGIIGLADARPSRRLRRKLARTVMNVGHVHYLNCDYEAAMATCHDALRLIHPNTEDAEVASVWHNMGVLLYHQGIKEDAIQYLGRFIDRAKHVMGPDYLQLAEAYQLEGIAIFEMGQLYECMAPLNEALRIRKLQMIDQNHSSIAESLCCIGRVLQAREEYDFCLRAFLEGMAIYRANATRQQQVAKSDDNEQTHGSLLSFDTAQTLLDVGRAFHAQNRIDEAIVTYEEVTDLTRQFFGVRHAFVARLDNIVGNLHLELGRVALALQKFTEAMKICLEQGLPVDYCVVKDPLCRVQHEHVPVAPMA